MHAVAEVPRVAYFEPAYAPGLRLFHCSRLRADLTPASCADNFVKRRYMSCVGCPVGSMHANGERPPHHGEAHRRVCVRCRRSGGQIRSRPGSTGYLRLVGGLICVSCFNRQGEVLRGKNAKGSAPRKWSALLRPRTIAFVKHTPDGPIAAIARLDLAADKFESLLTVMRRVEVPVSGHWSPAVGVLPALRPDRG